MKKIWDFLKSNPLIVKWTIGYFFMLWVILKYVFQFDALSLNYWWRFFHATLHGFSGFVFGIIIYGAIPIYIATTKTIYKTKEPIIKTQLWEKISGIFNKKSEPIESTEIIVVTPDATPENEYPIDLPSELRVPFMRAKNHMSLHGATGAFNAAPVSLQPNTPQQIMNDMVDTMPLPNDFDISGDIPSTNDNAPTFHDINFDTTNPTQKTPFENNTTKYFASKNIYFEIYKNFVATEKYFIYEHNDDDFWVMDSDTWFAAGKQIESPINELIEIAAQNGLKPVIYLHTTNIMDVENTIRQFESLGIRVIKTLDELD